ncbi:hypothetical protein HX867_35610, partial [Pseudomonas gingeri]|uniref:hypothetical protein n=2 Tax=Pseudomonas TaxID=286 RepID=UPI001853E84E
MDLFVLLGTTPRILRVVTSGELQEDLETELRRQAITFTNQKNDVPFDARYRPDEDELLLIDGFDDLDGLIAAVREPENANIWQPTED